uniref:Putative secreted protein n=1 Tax=Anopheles darlingi TaxID=43151 RepID=A0A2M4DIN3_ANODA
MRLSALMSLLSIVRWYLALNALIRSLMRCCFFRSRSRLPSVAGEPNGRLLIFTSARFPPASTFQYWMVVWRRSSSSSSANGTSSPVSRSVHSRQTQFRLERLLGTEALQGQNPLQFTLMPLPWMQLW